MDLKRKILAVFLVAVTLWPLVQIALVLRYGVNPWKLAGWGMYSAPDLPRAAVRVMRAPCGATDVVALHRMPKAARRSIEHFRRWRWTFGRLHAPDAVARQLALDIDPYARLDIVVVEPVFDYETKMIGHTETVYTYSGACSGEAAR